jgi:hypothetical protein
MASPGELTKTVAHVLGIDPTTVANIYRGLREAGLVTKGGRGRSAAVVTPRDAAMLLLGVCSSDSVKDAASAAQEYAGLRASIARVHDWSDVKDQPSAITAAMPPPRWTLTGFHLDELTALPVRHEAIDALAAFISLFSRKSDEPAKLILSQWDIKFAFEWPNPIFEIGLYARTSDDRHYSESMAYFDDGPGGVTVDVRKFTDEGRQQIVEELREKGFGHRIISGDLKVVRSFGITTLSRIGELIRGD